MGELIGGFDPGCEFLAVLGERAEIAFNLETVPEGVGLAKEGAEAQRHGGRN